MNKILLTLSLLIVAALSLGLSGCGTGNAADAAPDKAEIDMAETFIRDVRTDEAIIGDVEQVVSRVSTITAPDVIELLPQASGQLQALYIEEGSRVTKGQLVAELDNVNQKLAFERAQSTYEKRKYDHEIIQKQVSAKVLGEEELVQAAYLMNQAKSQLESAEVTLNRTRILSPISGVISARHVSEGDMVFPSSSLATIVDNSRLEADVMIPQNQVDEISVGNRVELIPGNDVSRAFKGTVARISPVVDVNNGTVKVTVAIPGKNTNVKPGTFVRVKVITGVLEDVVLIPNRAIVIENAMSVVYKVKEGRALRVPVELGYRNGDFTQAIGDIQVGDTLVVVGHTGLDDMVKVRVMNEEESTGSSEADQQAD